MTDNTTKDKPNYVIWGLIGLMAVGLIALFIYNATRPKDYSQAAWNTNMTKGDPQAASRVVVYSDVTCSNCAVFTGATKQGDFNGDYIDNGKVFMEVRIVPLLQDRRQNAVRSAESTYCAADQQKFWPYYEALVADFTANYFDKGVAVGPTTPDIPKLDDAYYARIAQSVGLDGDKMASCLQKGEKSEEVKSAVTRTAATLPYGSGVPYFQINDFSSSGFEGGYPAVQRLMQAGGVK